jgi:hypothetical protein
MPKEDVTRRAATKAAGILGKATAKLESLIPYGPTKAQYSPSELRKELKGARGESLLELGNQVGIENLLKLMEGNDAAAY